MSKLKFIKIKQGSDSSSEFSANDNSEQESCSFLIQRKKKNKKQNSKTLTLMESSPNMRFSRYDEKKFSEKNHIAYMGLDHDRGCDITWNIINISKLDETKKEKLFQELMFLKNLCHDNINTIYDSWLKDDNTLIFITDSFFGGSIRQYLYKIGIQKLKVIKGWLKNILLGLDYLHKNGIIIKDLSCGHIYYNNNNGMVSIGDLYVSSPILFKLIYSDKDQDIYPPYCISPELMTDCSYSDKSDIYSLGMVLIEMITIEIPYFNLHLQFSSLRHKIKDGLKPTALDRISDDPVKSFISKLIDNDPKKRPNVQELQLNEFLKINEKEDNRKIKLIRLKKDKKKKVHKDMKDSNYEQSYGKYNPSQRKNTFLFKQDFEEVPYHDDAKSRDKSFIYFGDGFADSKMTINPDLKEVVMNKRKISVSQAKDKNKSDKIREDYSSIKESTRTINMVTSSHEGGYTDVCHTNTDYMNIPVLSKKKITNIAENKEKINSLMKEESFEKRKSKLQPVLETNNRIDTLQSNLKSNTEPHIYPSNHYQIFDSHYNVHMKFLINQDSKLHEIQFTYNLLKDDIPDLMEEIQNEFNFSHDNLNQIYETLKKISIYSKFYKTSDILHDNSA